MPAETNKAPRSRQPRGALEWLVEEGLFASRWLLAPIYLGLVIGLAALVVVFLSDLWALISLILQGRIKSDLVILAVLTLIDISLAANLVLIVCLSGFENFVSKFDNEDHPDRPDWLGKIDFGGLKLKLIASVAAISAIQLLKVFVQDATLSSERIFWLIVIHMTFVVSGVLLAVMDWITAKSKVLGYDGS